MRPVRMLLAAGAAAAIIGCAADAQAAPAAHAASAPAVQQAVKAKPAAVGLTFRQKSGAFTYASYVGNDRSFIVMPSDRAPGMSAAQGNALRAEGSLSVAELMDVAPKDAGRLAPADQLRLENMHRNTALMTGQTPEQLSRDLEGMTLGAFFAQKGMQSGHAELILPSHRDAQTMQATAQAKAQRERAKTAQASAARPHAAPLDLRHFDSPPPLKWNQTPSHDRSAENALFDAGRKASERHSLTQDSSLGLQR